MSFEELLELYDNQYVYSELIKQMNNIIPFVGAGLSCSIYPLWESYLKSECKKYNIRDIDKYIKDEQYEEAAQHLMDIIGDVVFCADLKNTFSKDKLEKRKLEGAINLLPEIFPDSVVTTNFDCALEKVYEQAGCSFENILFPCHREQMTKTFMGNRHNLIKIHGDISENSFLVFTKTQYDEVYGEKVNFKKRFVQLLHNCIVGKTLLFLGCSLNKDRITEIMQAIMRRNNDIVHFAILEEPIKKEYASRTISLSKMGILPIYYPKGKHECIELILDDMKKKDIM